MTKISQGEFRLESFRRYNDLLLSRSHPNIGADKVGVYTLGNSLKHSRKKQDVISNNENLYLGSCITQNDLEEDSSDKM